MTFFAISIEIQNLSPLDKPTMAKSRKQKFAHVYENGRDFSESLKNVMTSLKKIDSLDNRDRADIEIILSPEANGTKFRYFEIQPTPENIPREKLEEAAAIAFEKIGAAHERIDTSRHHAMHQTKTIDYIILLKGDVTLLLDKDEVRLKPFDTVVQRGTNHAWVNNGNEPALLIAVLIDSDIKR